MRNKSEKNVWGLRPHTLFSLLLCNLGPQTPLRTQFLRNFNVSHVVVVVLGLPGGVDNPKSGQAATYGPLAYELLVIGAYEKVPGMPDSGGEGIGQSKAAIRVYRVSGL